MQLILTSNGLTSKPILEEFKRIYNNGYKNVAIIVTADPIYRKEDIHALSNKKSFENIGYKVDLIDIEFEESQKLKKYDVIYFIGGNPFYLLDIIRKRKTDRILLDSLSKGKLISGASAGSLVLGTTIGLINEFEPKMNKEVNLIDLSGVGLTKYNICPHYKKFCLRYENFEERVQKVEKELKLKFIRIKDGEAVVVKDGDFKII